MSRPLRGLWVRPGVVDFCLSGVSVSRKNLLLVLAGGSLLAGGAWFYSARPANPKPTGVESGYVNSSVCAGCHQDIAKTYRLTGMGRSFYSPSAENAIEDYKIHNTVYNRASDRYYTMIERDGKWYQQRYQIGFAEKEANVVEKQVEYVIGSGNHSRSYLFRNSEGNLAEMPVSWYSEKGGYWAMSPGYDRANQQDFRRTISNECFACHNAYPQAAQPEEAAQPEAQANASHFADPAFSDHVPQGIDCQRCHGPGRAHIEAVASKASVETIRSKIVNPAKLNRDRQLETCMQCHLETTSRMASKIPRYDHAPFSYRPGEPLGDYFAYFDHAPGTGHDDKFEIAHAAYRLRMSACFRSTQMTCTTCHNPHQIPRGEEATLHYVAVCKSCHADAHASKLGSETMPPKADCIGCHMPKRRSDDVVHAVMTDHYIQRIKSSRDLLAPLQEVDVVNLDIYRGEAILYYPKDDSKRPDGQLYIDVAQMQDSADLAPSIQRLQLDLEKNPPKRPEFYYELAEAYEKSGKHDQAIHWYDEALRLGPEFRPATDGLAVALIGVGNLDRAAEVLEKSLKETDAAAGRMDTVALTDLGNVYLKQGKPDAAAQTLNKALGVNPDIPEAQNLLGLALAQKQDWAGAERAFRAAISIQPDLAAAHQNLANLLAKSGDYAQARYHFEKAIAGEPNNAETRDRYGLLLAIAGAYDKALVELREAVRLNPNLAQAHADLADVLSAQGHIDSAADEYRRAIELNPQAYGAHLSLGQILARSGKLDEARAHFARAIESPDPEIRQAAQKALR
jgi:tetratricopeptide (TPR) repeat protein